MAYTLLDYLTNDWSPVASARADRFTSNWWAKSWVRSGAPASGIYVPALPTQNVPSPNSFVLSTADRFNSNYNLGIDTRSDLQRMWDNAAYYSLKREPALQPIWSSLNGTFSPLDNNRWNDFRRSTDFRPTVQTLGFRGGSLVRKSLGTVVKCAKRAIPFTRITPQGIAIWVASNLAWDLAQYGVKATWKAWKNYETEREKAQKGPYWDKKYFINNLTEETVPEIATIMEDTDRMMEFLTLETPSAFKDDDTGFVVLEKPTEFEDTPFIFSTQPQQGLPDMLIDFDTFLR
jgi:hypothetical protein